MDLCKDGNWTNVQSTETKGFVKTASSVLIAPAENLAHFAGVRAKDADVTMIFMGGFGSRQTMSWAQVGALVLLASVLFSHSSNAKPGARQREKTPATPRTDITVCECTILEYDPEFMFCDQPFVPKGSPHSLGFYPRFVVKLTSPEAHVGRQVEFILRGGKPENRSGSTKNHVGKPCTVELPNDFLAGQYKKYADYSDPHLIILPKPRKQ